MIRCLPWPASYRRRVSQPYRESHKHEGEGRPHGYLGSEVHTPKSRENPVGAQQMRAPTDSRFSTRTSNSDPAAVLLGRSTSLKAVGKAQALRDPNGNRGSMPPTASPTAGPRMNHADATATWPNPLARSQSSHPLLGKCRRNTCPYLIPESPPPTKAGQ